MVSGWRPYAYFKAMEEARCNTNMSNNMTTPDMQAQGIQVVNQPGRQNGGAVGNLSSAQDAMESGRLL